MDRRERNRPICDKRERRSEVEADLSIGLWINRTRLAQQSCEGMRVGIATRVGF